MSPAEYIELIRLNGDSAAGNAMNFVSLVFAYLVAVHFIGKKLNYWEIGSLTILYTFSLIFPALNSLSAYETSVNLASKFHSSNSVLFAEIFGDPLSLDGFQEVLLILYLLVWLTSIVYMVSIKRSEIKT